MVTLNNTPHQCYAPQSSLAKASVLVCNAHGPFLGLAAQCIFLASIFQ